MKLLRLLFFIVIPILLFNISVLAQTNDSQSGMKYNNRIVYLNWNQVVNFSLKNNLAIKSKLLDYEAQNLEYWRSLSSFLPTVSYSGLATHNLELPVFIFMGQRFVVGTNYSVQHSIDLTIPIFTGGARLFSLSAQNSLKKSLSEELKGREEEIVYSALQAYYGIMLSNELFKTAREAVDVAKENLDQVQKFYNAGTARELDLQRAKAQYSSALPQLEAASSNRLLSYQRLKSILDIPLNDSLVVSDSLAVRDFLDKYTSLSLSELKNIASDKRKDIRAVSHRFDAVKKGESLALAQFAPTVAFSANLAHQAQMDKARVAWNDYIRSKSIAISVQWPLFEGGRKIIDYQLAKIQTDQAKILMKQTNDIASLDVEENYYNYHEAEKNLTSLKDALDQSQESMRISRLMYNEGMSTQLDVLNAQLLYTQSKTNYLQGIFNYNVGQLALLQSIGALEIIWK